MPRIQTAGACHHIDHSARYAGRLSSGETASKSEFRIVKIILFGSHAKGTWVNDPVNGYISDYDILVIENKAALVEEDVVWQRAKEQIDRKVTSAPLGLIVHDLQEVNERLQQGHYFFKDIREEGIELFAATPKPLAEPGDLTEAEKQEIARKHYEQWFESAEQLFVFFQDGMKRQWLKQSAFLLHQSTERFFACTLLTCTNYLPKSHNIEKLGKLCAQIVLNLQRFSRSITNSTAAASAACNAHILKPVIQSIMKLPWKNWRIWRVRCKS
ncbi:hypothetical protein RND59_00690 [Vibrio ruber]|uniref:hypothetical protein n=1 Tax=Vibrio ruber TaxID=184755 RepID=UPI0028932AAB|nr:hypothetical protein [Vibrio ruber]WNJ95674.1 hypothetical protein RND59_00690 [Vibrio ruber]